MAIPAPEWAGQLVNYSEYLYLRTNQQVLSEGLLRNLLVSEDKARIGLQKQTKVRGCSGWLQSGSSQAGQMSVAPCLQVMAVFVGIEAGLFVPLCCLALYILLNLVNRTRLRTFNVFVVRRFWVLPRQRSLAGWLVVSTSAVSAPPSAALPTVYMLPRPVVLQLASKEIKLRIEDENDGSDDGDADDTWLRQVGLELQAASAEHSRASAMGVPPSLTTSVLPQAQAQHQQGEEAGSDKKGVLGYKFNSGTRRKLVSSLAVAVEVGQP